MGPKKEIKKEYQKRENGTENEKTCAIEDPINSESWKCVVMMAVERTNHDCFVLKEFMKESSKGRRQQVTVIDFNTFVMKILNDFANGELPYNYAFLLNFSTVFQEAVEYINKKMDVPVIVLVKVVKALLFYLREENLMRIKKIEAGPVDPIKAMAERPTNFGSTDAKKKDLTKKGDNGLKVRPPSATKQDTKLLKRGERAKYDQWIDDAPQNSYFDFYVLLSGFYNPDFPLELIRANIPLHAVLCIDTSLSGVKRETSSTRNKFQKRNSEMKSEEIQNFWEVFLKKLWDPELSFYFRDVIFQVYVPQRLLCEKKKLREFIYREISYLMYDLSDLKRQLNNYLDHMRLRNVEKNESEMPEPSNSFFMWPENLSNKCVSVPIILQCIIDAICKGDSKYQCSFSSDSIDSGESDWRSWRMYFSLSQQAKHGSCAEPVWSQELEEKGDFNFLNIYFKIKELDVKYDLSDKKALPSENELVEAENVRTSCHFQPQKCGENMEAALSSDEHLLSYWKKYDTDPKTLCDIDYCLYALLMTKVMCSYQMPVETKPTKSYHSLKKNSNFELIENLVQEMRKPHFTITEGSRTILSATPYNMKNTSRDFFCPEQYKIVSPEKLKASSEPGFRVAPALKIHTLCTSEVFSVEVPKNPLQSLEGFVAESLFSNTNDFNFLEFLSQPKLLSKKQEYWSRYNCIDHMYSVLNDSVLLMLHNRKDSQNTHHETFNETLKTAVGLKDFYEYVLEDEASWLANEEKSYQTKLLFANNVPETNSFKNFSESDFWLVDSLKYQTLDKKLMDDTESGEIKTKWSSTEKPEVGETNVTTEMNESYSFEGYNVSDMAVQFSGLKTVYYSNDCSVTVQLIERLYGSQDLGVHVTEASHTLHLYSQACPEPHLLDPFTLHVTYKNGVVVAFGRRSVEVHEEIEEAIESTTTIKNKRNSWDLSSTVVKKQISKSVRDEDFIYDMAASLPNGLSIRTVRKVVEPCYIKQFYVTNKEETGDVESSRLYLPNGNVIKMMNSGMVQIFQGNASIVTANLNDLDSETEGESLNFARYEVISGEGYACVFERGEMKSSKRLQVFQNTDMDTNQVFFRRRDGTNYMLQSNGTFCVQFKDGTKMSSSLLVHEGTTKASSVREFDSNDETEETDETELGADFVFVFTQIIAEHPDYATVIYDGQTQNWRILLPHDSTITIQPDGQYSVDIDDQTELKVEADLIRMNHFSSEREPRCCFTADLTVFEKLGGAYCHMKDERGQIFIIEGNSNSYVLDQEAHSDFQGESWGVDVVGTEPEMPQRTTSENLPNSPSVSSNKGNKLLLENKYFVLRRDMTGIEVLHEDDVAKALTKTPKGSLVFTQHLPSKGNRCFVLVTPVAAKEMKEWQVASIIPNPKYEPNVNRKTSSSTYGIPPSWMHPFPKRKLKFVVPQALRCRVFVETKKTDFSPKTGTIDCYFCEMGDLNEVQHSQIPPEGVEEYLKRLSEDDQDVLKEIYHLAAASLINEKKNLKPINSDKLEHYLEMSRYYVAMREYHKKCIRYHIIPNYFQHPAGMSWLILNQLLLRLNLPDDSKIFQRRTNEILERTIDSSRSLKSGLTTSEFSNEEIEYNLSLSERQSFSSLSCRLDLSAETAPPVLRTEGICRGRVKVAKVSASSPIVWCTDKFLESNFEEPQPGICAFQENDLEMLEKKDCEAKEMLLMSLEDLMYLGLV